MAITTGLNNDVRGWILCFISGIGTFASPLAIPFAEFAVLTDPRVACVFGASVVCVDILIRMLPGKSNFRIQESNAFLACSLSLSFGVMVRRHLKLSTVAPPRLTQPRVDVFVVV